MVQIKSPGGKAKEEVQDDVGEALRDGLAYDDATNSFDVLAGTGVLIDGSGNVRTDTDELQAQSITASEGYAPGFGG